MSPYRPLDMAKQNQDDLFEHTYNSYVRIRDLALKTSQMRWTIGKSGERGSGISVLAARHDDDDIYIYIYIYERHTISFQTFFVWAFNIVVDSRKFSMLLLYIVPIVQTLLPVTFGYSRSSEAIVMRQLRRWKKPWRRSLTRSHKRTSMEPCRNCRNGATSGL